MLFNRWIERAMRERLEAPDLVASRNSLIGVPIGPAPNLRSELFDEPAVDNEAIREAVRKGKEKPMSERMKDFRK
ncbi:MAG TPA: hypothetical protein VFO46_02310 [Candidatus Sulfotelmatobacter sp.]|nr:hypothetical protein [Candidatus Sulfotelmatobacter sp.]